MNQKIRKRWTKEEEGFLKSNYPDLGNPILANKLNRSLNSIQTKLARLGLQRHKRWSKWELDLLKTYPAFSIQDLEKKLGRPRPSILQKTNMMGIRKVKKRKNWTEEEDQFLFENYKNLTQKEISKELNREEDTIRRRLRKIGLTSSNYVTEYQIPQLTNFDIGYIAGFIDGEGCVTFQIAKKNGVYCSVTPHLEISQKDKTPLDYIVSKLELNWRPITYVSHGSGCWHFWVSGLKVAAQIISFFEPYLMVKKKQAKLITKFLNQHKERTPLTKKDWKIVLATKQAIFENRQPSESDILSMKSLESWIEQMPNKIQEELFES